MISDASRPLPSSHEAEKGLLCACFAGPDAVIPFCIRHGVAKEWFHLGACGIVWEVMAELHLAGKSVDLVLVQQVLMDRSLLEAIGGPATVADIFMAGAVASAAPHYLDVVREKWTRRTIITACMDLIQDCYDRPDEDLPALVTKAEDTMYQIDRTATNAAADVEPMRKFVMEGLEQIERKFKNRGKCVDGLATGFTDLDRMTMGLKPRNLVVIGARPSVGKTALMQCIAENVGLGVAHYQDYRGGATPTLLISMEMSGTELVERMLVSRAGIHVGRLHDAFMRKDEMSRLMTVSKEFSAAPIWIWDATQLTIQEIRARVRQLVKKEKIGLVCVDYLQLIKSKSPGAKASREREVADVAEGLKAMAKEHAIVVMALAQLNREVEQRGKNAKPTVADLRESGQIEQAADLALLLYRPARVGGIDVPAPDWFREEYPGADDKEVEDRWKQKAALIIGKQRNGPTGEVNLKWEGMLTRFESQTDRLFSNNDDHRQKS